MNWVKVRRNAFSSNEPLISLHSNRFSYNVTFFRIAELSKFIYVSYYLDSENRRIGFEFTKEELPDSFKLVKSSKKGNHSGSTELFAIPWIKKVS